MRHWLFGPQGEGEQGSTGWIAVIPKQNGVGRRKRMGGVGICDWGNDKFVSKHWEEILTGISIRNSTISVWVTDVADYACTRWNMIHYMTFGILATTSAAWILAFVMDTGFVRWTVRVMNAFGATSVIRIAIILRQTLARADTILLPAIGIWAAWTGNTRR